MLSDEYQGARVSVIFLLFLHNFVLAKVSSSIRVKNMDCQECVFETIYLSGLRWFYESLQHTHIVKEPSKIHDG